LNNWRRAQIVISDRLAREREVVVDGAAVWSVRCEVVVCDGDTGTGRVIVVDITLTVEVVVGECFSLFYL
jgi:hypothetical protein